LRGAYLAGNGTPRAEFTEQPSHGGSNGPARSASHRRTLQKIEDVQRQSGPRDAEAEAYLRSLLAQNPAAAYYMAQTIIVQEQALNAAQRRIEELETQGAPSRSGGGLLGSLFGGGSSRVPNTGSQRRPQPQEYQQPWGSSSGGMGRGMGMGMGGGGFLAGAAQTAMGVAGGVVLGNMLADMLSPDEAAAAGIGDNAAAGSDEVSAADAGDDNVDVADAGGDFGGGDFGGGDFGDFG
jgi:hypothetical protein